MNSDSGDSARPRIAVAGAAGRMGRAVARAVEGAENLELAAVIEADSHPSLGTESAGGLPLAALSAEALEECDVLIEFTQAGAPMALAEAAVAAGCGLVSGTTALDEAEEAALVKAAERIPIVRARNMSLGITVLASLAETAAAALDDAFDIEIMELHHCGKRDAPSGTARLLGEAAASGRGGELGALEDAPRQGPDQPREKGRIGFASLRGGSSAGEHTVLFLGNGERLELTHRADSRELFVAGALRAARWLIGRPPGLYSMRDVLGL